MTNDKALPTLTDALPELHPLPHDWTFDADFVRNYACAYGQRCYERGQTVERALWNLSASSEEIERIGRAATTREAVAQSINQASELDIVSILAEAERQSFNGLPNYREGWREAITYIRVQLAYAALETPRATPPSASAIVEGAADVPIAGYAVHSDQSFDRVALYGREDHDEALDAARRWKASVTALAIHPNCPVPSGLASPPAAHEQSDE